MTRLLKSISIAGPGWLSIFRAGPKMVLLTQCSKGFWSSASYATAHKMAGQKIFSFLAKPWEDTVFQVGPRKWTSNDLFETLLDFSTFGAIHENGQAGNIQFPQQSNQLSTFCVNSWSNRPNTVLEMISEVWEFVDDHINIKEDASLGDLARVRRV